MTTETLVRSTRRAILCSCLAFSLLAAVPARADNPPKFKDAEATAYVQKVSDGIDALLKAVQAKDDAKTKELDGKLKVIMNEGDPIMKKLPPDDMKTAREWLRGQEKKLTDAGYKP